MFFLLIMLQSSHCIFVILLYTENKLSGSSIRLRPLPNLYLGMFKRLCNGQCNGNVNCTFPHNLEELDAWNKERSAKRSKFIICFYNSKMHVFSGETQLT